MPAIDTVNEDLHAGRIRLHDERTGVRGSRRVLPAFTEELEANTPPPASASKRRATRRSSASPDGRRLT